MPSFCWSSANPVARIRFHFRRFCMVKHHQHVRLGMPCEAAAAPWEPGCASLKALRGRAGGRLIQTLVSKHSRVATLPLANTSRLLSSSARRATSSRGPWVRARTQHHNQDEQGAARITNTATDRLPGKPIGKGAGGSNLYRLQQRPSRGRLVGDPEKAIHAF